MLHLKTFYVHIKPILQDWTVAETWWKLARSLSRSSWCPKAFLRAAHYFKPFVLKRYQKRLIVHRYILRVTPVLPKFAAKSTHDPKPAPPESIDFRKKRDAVSLLKIVDKKSFV